MCLRISGGLGSLTDGPGALRLPVGFLPPASPHRTASGAVAHVVRPAHLLQHVRRPGYLCDSGRGVRAVVRYLPGRAHHLRVHALHSPERGVAQLGSALALGARGRGFKSRHPDQVSGH